MRPPVDGNHMSKIQNRLLNDLVGLRVQGEWPRLMCVIYQSIARSASCSPLGYFHLAIIFRAARGLTTLFVEICSGNNLVDMYEMRPLKLKPTPPVRPEIILFGGVDKYPFLRAKEIQSVRDCIELSS